MKIRQELEKDYKIVESIIQNAFLTAEHSDGTEQDLVLNLRKSDAFVPELSIVAEVEDKIVGHILFTEAKVGEDTVLVLAPLAVLPEYQCLGIGSKLILKGHSIATKKGYNYSVVLGSEKYYPKFGYITAELLGIETPKGIPAVNFMAIKLNPNAKKLSGKIKYSKE
ncbi:N-acetyltransferase, partial [Peptostreptococcaceae bacterium OttesenSCG-928-C18]|nr:N-acetyltransferase [Peptostreptococcaceae bacterium OttesenSCG-928-C18]